MAYVAFDQNEQEQQNTTNVLGTPSSSTPTSNNQQSEPKASSTYVSNGNPYGQYSQNTQQSQTPTQSVRKTNTGASSGQQTNVQMYIDKNQKSSQNLADTTSNKLQNTSDIAKKNLEGVQNKFSQGMEAGSLENRQGAVQEAQGAFTQAANATGPERQWNANEASLYSPEKGSNGAYSTEDQSLVDSNKARVKYGDGSFKDFATQADATDDITSYNRQNPGYFTYAPEKELDVNNDRLSKILNAQYQGPNELNEISGYGDAYNKFQDASQLQNQTLKGGNNNELLNRTFSTPQNQYNQGAKLLDNLLLGQGSANEKLRSTAETLGTSPSGKLMDDFKAGTRDARTSAAARTQELDTIKQDARKALMDTSAGRSKEVNDRVNNVVENWDKYPQYFKDKFKQELDNHNISSTKKKEYDTIAPAYAELRTKMDMYNTPEIKAILANDQLDNYTPEEVKRQEAIILSETANPYEKENAYKYLSGYDEIGLKIRNDYKNDKQKFEQMQPQLEELSKFANYDPNALNVGLSQLEAESLGIKGGEGLYNLLNDPNIGIDGLFKTTKADRNQLVSTDEQSQLARLESLAKLAKDYGVKGSGINLVNQYNDRDAAGQQNATSALDMDNFERMLQGGERSFRNDAEASNIVGSGYGTGSSGGLFGKKKAQAWSTLNQNFGDLVQQGGGYRDIYSNEGVNKDLLRQASEAAKGIQTSQIGYTDPGLIGGVADSLEGLGKSTNFGTGDALSKTLGFGSNNDIGKAVGFVGDVYTGNLGNAYANLSNVVGSTLGGSKAAAQGEANRNAQANALANLQANITNKINTTGLKNQLSVNQNNERDMELFKLLGMMDTTNL